MSAKLKRQGLLVTLGLILGGVVCAGVMMLIFFVFFPDLLPRPGMVVYRVEHGDIFFNHPEWMAIPENYQEVLSRHVVLYDDDGFRLPERPADTYQVLAVGDSYTEAANVGRTWADVLAEKSGLTVRNLGFRGFGPLEEAEVIRRYAPESGAGIIVVGFFEGNDFGNVVAEELQPMPDVFKPEDRVMRTINWDDYPNRDERYPMRMTVGGVEQDIAFFEWYVWGLNGEKAAYQDSINLEKTAQSWQTMREAAPDQCLIVVYFPSKEHVYLPYLTPDSQTRLMQKAHTVEGERLQTTPTATTFEELMSRLGNMRDAVQERAAQEGVLFFDTTPVLQDAAARGEVVAYIYDTHWNQRGHELVGEAVAQYLDSNSCNK